METGVQREITGQMKDGSPQMESVGVCCKGWSMRNRVWL